MPQLSWVLHHVQPIKDNPQCRSELQRPQSLPHGACRPALHRHSPADVGCKCHPQPGRCACSMCQRLAYPLRRPQPSLQLEGYNHACTCYVGSWTIRGPAPKIKVCEHAHSASLPIDLGEADKMEVGNNSWKCFKCMCSLADSLYAIVAQSTHWEHMGPGSLLDLQMRIVRGEGAACIWAQQ